MVAAEATMLPAPLPPPWKREKEIQLMKVPEWIFLLGEISRDSHGESRINVPWGSLGINSIVLPNPM